MSSLLSLLLKRMVIIMGCTLKWWRCRTDEERSAEDNQGHGFIRDAGRAPSAAGLEPLHCLDADGQL